MRLTPLNRESAAGGLLFVCDRHFAEGLPNYLRKILAAIDQNKAWSHLERRYKARARGGGFPVTLLRSPRDLPEDDFPVDEAKELLTFNWACYNYSSSFLISICCDSLCSSVWLAHLS